MSTQDAANASEMYFPFASNQQRATMTARSQVVSEWCEKMGILPEEITLEHLLEVRSLPEWQNAS